MRKAVNHIRRGESKERERGREGEIGAGKELKKRKAWTQGNDVRLCILQNKFVVQLIRWKKIKSWKPCHNLSKAFLGIGNLKASLKSGPPGTAFSFATRLSVKNFALNVIKIIGFALRLRVVSSRFTPFCAQKVNLRSRHFRPASTVAAFN